MARRLRTAARMTRTQVMLHAVCCASLASVACGGKRPSQLLDRSQDQRIRREVEARLAAEPVIGPGRMRVAVEGGTVQLHGAVQGLGALKCAVTNAGLVQGVRLVVDMTVLERGPVEARCLAPRPVPSVVTTGG